MASISNQVTTTTNKALVNSLVDSVLNSNVAFTRLVMASKPWTQGKQWEQPIKVSKNSNGGAYSGSGTFNTSATDTRQILSFNPSFYEQPVVINGIDVTINMNTNGKALNLMETEIESNMQDLADTMGTDLYGNNTGTDKILGFIDLVDDGTTQATIGGLSRSTYTTLAGTVTASGGALTLAKMATLLSAVRSGAQKPTIGITDESTWDLYQQLLQPQERINKDVSMVKGLKGGTGFVGLNYSGFDVVADEKCTSGVLFFINEDFLDVIALPNTSGGKRALPFKSSIKGNDYSKVKGLGFTWSDWIIPSNQDALIGHIYWGGQVVTNNPKRHGKLTGITTI